MSPNEKRILGMVLAGYRRRAKHPVVSMHILDQDLVDSMSKIIIELARKLDTANIEWWPKGASK